MKTRKILCATLVFIMLLLCLSSCIRGGDFDPSYMTKKHGNTKWETKDGKLVFWICEDDLINFGYLYKDNGEKIPIQLHYYHGRTLFIEAIDYFDGTYTTFTFDRTLPPYPSINIGAGYNWYRKGDKELRLSFNDSERELADIVGLPKDMTLYMVETNIPSEKVLAEYPEIHLPPNYDLYLEYWDMLTGKLNYEEIVERYGICEAYTLDEERDIALYCKYPAMKNGDGITDYYWALSFTRDGSMYYALLESSENISDNYIPVKEGDPAPTIPQREIEQEETKATAGFWDAFREYFF